MARKDYAKLIAENLIAKVESGVALPWHKSWAGDVPRNALTGRPYRGVNVWITSLTSLAEGYESNRWLTFRQAKEAGGSVKKGEKATWVVFWKLLRKGEGDDERVIPLMKVYKVFNVDQCTGLDPEKLAPARMANDNPPLEVAESIVQGYSDPPHMAKGEPSYAPATDTVRMPERKRFDGSEEYYSTLFHELAHSTGHKKRLGRAGVTGAIRFGSETYSREELVAEMSAAMLCGHAGIDGEIFDNSAAYVAGWLGYIKKDPRALVDAAQAAQKAVDHILGTTFE